MSYFEEMTQKAKAAVSTAAEKAREVADSAKISAAIIAEKRELDKSYRALGQWYACEYGAGEVPEQMGLPVNQLICASNRNNVLTDFITTGRYDRNRKFYATTSPSMDILISSNLERLLYLLTGRSDAETREKMAALRETGVYQLDEKELSSLQKEFWGGCCGDEAAAETIGETFRKYSYLCDPHTAVAVNVWEQYRRATGDHTKTVILSTASPYKFGDTVLAALGERCPEDDFARLAELEKVSGLPVPASLAALKDAPCRFPAVCRAGEMGEKVLEFLG